MMKQLPTHTAQELNERRVKKTQAESVESYTLCIITREHRKLGIVSPFMLPGVAIFDPELTDGTPPFLTAATGMDALSIAWKPTWHRP